MYKYTPWTQVYRSALTPIHAESQAFLKSVGDRTPNLPISGRTLVRCCHDSLVKPDRTLQAQCSLWFTQATYHNKQCLKDRENEKNHTAQWKPV